MECCSEDRKRILQNIRVLCDSDGRELCPEQTGKYYLKLANFYKDDSWWSFICRSTLLNAALNRLNDEEPRTPIENQIRSLGIDLLKKSKAEKSDLNLHEISGIILEKLNLRRSTIETELQKIPKIPYEVPEHELLKLERERIQTIKSLMQKVSDFYLDTMADVSRICIEALGKPPCKFSHFAMGSLAREEITLYSDFENAILLEDETVPDTPDYQSASDGNVCAEREDILEYFKWYAVLFHVILINFGQTPIHMIGIEGLNDQYSNNKTDNWLYDVHTQSGITFDSFLPYASKTPFGRGPTHNKPFTTELILPKREMLLFLGEERSLSEGYHLSDMLLESRHVTGDESLFNLFKNEGIQMMGELTKCSDYIENSTRTAKDDLKKFDLTPEFATLGWTQNVKKLYYRPMSVYIPWLARICGVFGCRNSFEAIKRLVEENDSLVSQSAKHNLSYALAVANQLRLKVYSDRSRQSDTMTGAVHLLQKTSKIMNVFDAVGERCALDFCEISLGLTSAITEIVDVIHNHLDKTGTFDKRIILSILNRHVSPRGDLKLHGNIYRHFQHYEMAIACYEKDLRRCRDGSSATDRPFEDEVEILMTLGLTNLYILKFWNAVQYYKGAIELERGLNRKELSNYNIAMACTMMGQCYIEMPPLRCHYGPCMEEGIRLWQELLSSDPTNATYVKGFAEARDTEGFYFLRTRQFLESLEKYKEAANLFEDFYGEEVNNNTMKVQNGIAMCYLGLERYEEAAKMFDEVICSKQSVIGKQVADVTISWYLRNKADALKNLEKFDEAIEYYKHSIAMRKAAPGSEYDIFAAAANTTCRLADCYFRSGRDDEALQATDEVLILVSHISNTVKGKEFTEMAQKLQKDVEERQKSHH